MSSEDIEANLIKRIQNFDVQNPTDFEQALILNFEEEGKRQGGF